MSDGFDTQSSLMAGLSISAIDKASKDPSCWKEPVLHSALLVSGLSVLIGATQLIINDLEIN